MYFSTSTVTFLLFISFVTAVPPSKKRGIEPMTVLTHIDWGEDSKIPAYVITRVEDDIRKYFSL